MSNIESKIRQWLIPATNDLFSKKILNGRDQFLWALFGQEIGKQDQKAFQSVKTNKTLESLYPENNCLDLKGSGKIWKDPKGSESIQKDLKVGKRI